MIRSNESLTKDGGSYNNILEQVGVYTPRGVVPPARHLSHIVYTKIGNINETTKHWGIFFGKLINMTICPLLREWHGGSHLKYPLPPSVSPPYMTF